MRLWRTSVELREFRKVANPFDIRERLIGSLSRMRGRLGENRVDRFCATISVVGKEPLTRFVQAFGPSGKAENIDLWLLLAVLGFEHMNPRTQVSLFGQFAGVENLGFLARPNHVKMTAIPRAYFP